MRSTNRPVTVAAILLSMFMAAMEATVVATAMPTAIGDLHGIELYGWVGAIYMLSTTVAMPLFGKLADLYGRKPIMLLGLVVFLIGSAASGMSGSMVQLIAFRAVQGVGAGALQPIALTIIGDLFRPEQRARISGVFGAVWGIAGMIGPLVGGLIVKALSWRWVFYINVPFGTIAGLLLIVAFHESIEKKEHKLDLLGAALLAGGIISLLLGVSGKVPLLTLPLAVVLIAAFIVAEKYAREPILPIPLFRQRILAVSSATGALMGSTMMTTVVYVPLFVQAVLRGTPTQGGMAVTPMLIGWPIASTLSGRLLTRVGYRPLVCGGFGIVAVAAILHVWILRAVPGVASIGAVMAMMGVGLGLANTALLIAVQESVTWQERGIATASTMFFRTIGGAVFVGALGALLAASLGPDVPLSTLNQVVGPEHGRGMDPAVLAQLSAAIGAGLGPVFQAIAVLACVGFGVSLLFPKARLRTSKAPPPPAAASGQEGLAE
jgi:EmrB/QacA subfamily drug resistance transporter